jgi:zinc D-Ala-D-Ala carboxypeptidase
MKWWKNGFNFNNQQLSMKQIMLLFLTIALQSAFTPQAKPTVTADYLMGKFDPTKHPDFVVIDKKYASKTDMYLRKETYEAFKKMAVAAEKEGVIFTIISSTRNFDYQKSIWETKWAALKDKTAEARAKKILQYSAMPGASRHHWGTDIDLNNLTNPFFEKNGGKKIYDWLKAHGHEYGFYQPYTAGRTAGYKEEKWHWTYLPLSKDFTTIAGKYLTNEMISGFKGSETASKIDIVKNYVLGINKECL